jgi:uncharacterized protein YeaO (DUF488 family)
MTRVYDAATRHDGYRVLIDRLWPRGIKKSNLRMDEWAKELAPSSELRQAFGHKPERWGDFQSRYRSELRMAAAQKKLGELASRAKRGNVTLLYSAKDEAHNDAIVVKQILERKARALKGTAKAA